MTIGKIKIEALKLMYLSARDVHEEELDALGANHNYADYLAAMPGCIDRAIQDMVTRKILPKISEKVTPETYDGKVMMKIRIPEKMYEVERIIFESLYEYVPRVSYYVEGEYLVIPRTQEKGEYIVEGYPKVERVTDSTRNDAEPNIPDELTAAVPYFIKSELFTSDIPGNASEAAQARQYYEAVVARYARRNDNGTQKRVKTVMGRW